MLEPIVSLRTRTILMLSVVLVIGVALTLLVLAPIEVARRQAVSFNTTRTRLAAAMDRTGVAAVADGYAMLATGRARDRQRHLRSLDAFDAALRQFITEDVAHPVPGEGNEEKLVAEATSASAELRTIGEETSGRATLAEVIRFREVAERLDEAVDGLGEIEGAAAEAASASLAQSVVTARNVAIVVWSVAFLVVLIGGWLVSYIMARPILALRDSAKNIANGDLSTPIELRQSGEIGELADALRTMQGSLRTTVSELEDEVDERATAEASARAAADKLEEMNVELGREVSQREHAQEQLITANERLGVNLDSLERVMAENDLLTEMAGLLQSDIGISEAHGAIGEYARRLFPGQSGALYVFDPSGDAEVTRAASFGDETLESRFESEACWAIRLARVHASSDTASRLACPHLHDHSGFGHVCVPLIAHGMTLGSITVLAPFGSENGNIEGTIASYERLAVRLAEHAALALSSLHLRMELREQSIRDPLTGLYNRRYLSESLFQEIARATRVGSQLGVLMIDVDRFKDFNDRWGHDVGDDVLAKVGEWLLGNSRAEDTVSRWGGEEFVVVIPNMTAEHVTEWAVRLREGVRGLHADHDGTPIPGITVSIGAAMFPDDGSTGTELMGSADAALYRAKAEGRDRVVLASDVPASGEEPV